MSTRIVLYGAAGHTGRFVAAELARQEFAPILAGRDVDKLAAIAGRLGAESRHAEVTDPAALDRMLTGADLLINAAGPFGASASGRDIYAVPAPIVVEAVRWILEGRSRAAGVVAPAELVDARDFLSALPDGAISVQLQ